MGKRFILSRRRAGRHVESGNLRPALLDGTDGALQQRPALAVCPRLDSWSSSLSGGKQRRPRVRTACARRVQVARADAGRKNRRRARAQLPVSPRSLARNGHSGARSRGNGVAFGGIGRQAMSKAVTASRLFYVELGARRGDPAFYADASLQRRQVEAVSKLLGKLSGGPGSCSSPRPRGRWPGLSRGKRARLCRLCGKGISSASSVQPRITPSVDSWRAPCQLRRPHPPDRWKGSSWPSPITRSKSDNASSRGSARRRKRLSARRSQHPLRRKQTVASPLVRSSRLRAHPRHPCSSARRARPNAEFTDWELFPRSAIRESRRCPGSRMSRRSSSRSIPPGAPGSPDPCQHLGRHRRARSRARCPR